VGGHCHGAALAGAEEEEDSRPQGGLYRIMVFAFFYPQLSPNGHYLTREMVTLDGEAISEIENAIIK
jgi:hypothetical protein